LRPILRTRTETRRAVALDALLFAYDFTVPAAYPNSLYIRGGQPLQHGFADRQRDFAFADRHRRGAAAGILRPADGGKMMERAVVANPAITGADCSGGVVGLMRHAGGRAKLSIVRRRLLGERFHAENRKVARAARRSSA
jgi:hypothetical protein